MADPKQVYRASDTAPAALYAKRASASDDVYPVLVDTSGALLTNSGTSYDYMALTISPDTTETYVYKTGGSTGTTIATTVVVYTDASRSIISTVTKS